MFGNRYKNSSNLSTIIVSIIVLGFYWEMLRLPINVVPGYFILAFLLIAWCVMSVYIAYIAAYRKLEPPECIRRLLDR